MSIEEKLLLNLINKLLIVEDFKSEDVAVIEKLKARKTLSKSPTMSLQDFVSELPPSMQLHVQNVLKETIYQLCLCQNGIDSTQLESSISNMVESFRSNRKQLKLKEIHLQKHENDINDLYEKIKNQMKIFSHQLKENKANEINENEIAVIKEHCTLILKQMELFHVELLNKTYTNEKNEKLEEIKTKYNGYLKQFQMAIQHHEELKLAIASQGSAYENLVENYHKTYQELKNTTNVLRQLKEKQRK